MRGRVSSGVVGVVCVLGVTLAIAGLGCGDSDGAAGTGGSTPSTGGDGGGGGGGGGGGMICEPCPAPPPDLPLDLEIVENGQLRYIYSFPFVEFLPRRVVVYVPAGYDERQSYPVAYITDGQAYSSGTVTALGDAIQALVAQGLIEPHILVFVDSTEERTRELTPDEDTLIIPEGEVSGDGDAFAGEIVDRVKSFVDYHFATCCGRSFTTIVGYSFGGLLCLHMLMRDPDVFGRGACMSPGFWWSSESVLRRFSAYDGPLPERLWFDVGTLEVPTPEFVEEYPEFDRWRHTRAIRAARDLAIDHGMVLGDDLGYYEEFDSPHDFSEYRSRIPTALAFTLSEVTLTTRTPVGHGFHVWQEQIFVPPATHPSLTASTVSLETRYDDPFVLTRPNREVSLSSRDEAIATIDAEGFIQAIAAGTAHFDASYMGFDATGAIEVVPEN